MKNIPHDTDAIHMPPDLLAQARQAASEEHRPADELVSDAVRRYLAERKPLAASPRQKSLSQLLMDSPLAGADLDLERRKEYPRPVEL